MTTLAPVQASRVLQGLAWPLGLRGQWPRTADFVRHPDGTFGCVVVGPRVFAVAAGNTPSEALVAAVAAWGNELTRPGQRGVVHQVVLPQLVHRLHN